MAASAEPAPAALVDEVHAWLASHWRADLTVRQWWAALVDAGYAHPRWPRGVGGRDLSRRDSRAITVALASHDVVAPAAGHLGATLAAPTLLAHGTPEQVERLVRPIALGEVAWCQLFSEPGAGSDLPSVATRAEPDGEGWVVSGQKVWSSGADRCDMGMLLARTGEPGSGRGGLTYFVVDMHQPGVEVRPLRVMDGTTPFCEVFLTDARVEADDRIGEVGSGWRVAQTTLASEREMVAGGGVKGLHVAPSGGAADLEVTVGEVVARSRASSPARAGRLRSGAVPATVVLDLARAHGTHRDPVTRQELARYWSQVKVNGWLMRRSAAAGGRLTGVDGNLAKLSTARICQQSRELVYRVAGSSLLLTGPDSPMGGDLQRVNLASPGTRLGGGTDEIQQNLIGERGLGLPRSH